MIRSELLALMTASIASGMIVANSNQDEDRTRPYELPEDAIYLAEEILSQRDKFLQGNQK